MAISNELVKGSVEPILLSLLKERAMYGYEIIKVVNERTNNAFQWKEGTLYPWLHRLEGDGVIASEWIGPEDGRPRKYYRITSNGLKLLDSKVAEWASFTAAVNVLLFGANPA